MGLFDGLKKALYDEVPDQNAPKAAEQKVTPLVTNANFQQPVTYQSTDNVFGSTTGQSAQPAISEEDKKKYQDYFSNLYTKAKAKSADYGQFLTNIETVMETDPTLADASKFKMAFSFMKKQGVTKERLVASVNDAIGIVENDRTTVFNADIQAKNANIESNNKLIADKQLAIQKLTEEINQLKTDTETIKNRISIKTLLYNSLAAQLITKIKNDLSGINNFI